MYILASCSHCYENIYMFYNGSFDGGELLRGSIQNVKSNRIWICLHTELGYSAQQCINVIANLLWWWWGNNMATHRQHGLFSGTNSSDCIESCRLQNKEAGLAYDLVPFARLGALLGSQ